MTDTAVSRLEFRADMVVQEFGWDSDVDDTIRQEIEGIIGSPLEDEYYKGVSDAVIVWWREDDPDLTDLLVDALTALDGGGVVWLFTPTAGQPGAPERHEIEEAAQTAALHTTTSFVLCPGWSAIKLLPRVKSRP